ncbi:MAG: divergent PAP2 family protein [Candidatus Pacebacteria bacterium]|nr:divergent PAP2 family protein [Candidatus Paceibacterota bacterium]
MIYPIVLIPIIIGITTQLTKFLLSIIKHKKIELKYLLISGHMPSAHTAFVVSITTIVGIRETIFSTLFAITFVFSYIVVYDALKIRINIGKNGKIINKLVREISGINEDDYPILRERVGHKPLEVLVGGIFGFLMTILLIQFF